MKLLKNKRSQLEEGRLQAQKNLTAVKNDLGKAGYDIELSDKRDSIISRLSMIEDNLKENKKLTSEADQNQQNLAKVLSQMKKKISRIFNFKTFKGKGYGYKFQIEYKDTCPPYQYSCPLPREKAQRLLEIFSSGKVPLVCERYANFLNW